PIRPPADEHFAPISPPERPLSRTEQEAILGRPLADGLTWEQYRDVVGFEFGGGWGVGGAPRDVDGT
ncbi:MAG TPA: hypothetical protein VHF67_08515, partial [Gaiellaceae bacterium]|nr:hypothetical protein [Gaiellaceae bacterium]